jgi:diguanylate cyclase (GGDEF)-like protein/PAS domain S-box-containing protein
MVNPEDETHVLISELRDKAASLEELERRVGELEKIRMQLFGDGQRLRRELEEAHEILNQWEWFFENSIDILCVLGVDGYFKRINKAFELTLGYRRETFLSQPIVYFVHPDDFDRTAAELRALNSGRDTLDFEVRFRHADGSWRWLSWTCPGRTLAAPYLYAIARDVSERKRSEQEILFLARHDVLTGLVNRAVFELELLQAIARTERNSNNAVALFLLDLDGFKAVNDSLGHLAGDHVLKTVAERLRMELRKSDLVCRLGGDEFALIVEGPTISIEVHHVAEKLIAAVNKPIAWDTVEVTVGCSIGIALFPNVGNTQGGLLSLADSALYAAKNSGKNCFRFYA